MKKLAAIAILAIFTFNMMGYQLVYNYMASKADAALELALDAANYNDADLISIKQATNLPYYSNNQNFQRIDGEVTIEGVHYKYVKCRIYNDSLEMLCIPNKQRMNIEESKNAYAKGAHDFQQDNTKKKAGESSKTAQKQLSEFEELRNEPMSAITFVFNQQFFIRNTPVANTGYFITDEQPPDTFLFS